MEFDFVYEEQMRKLHEDNGYEYVPYIKGAYVYPNDIIWINLSALQFKKPEPIIIAEICVGLHHEYLHKAIKDIRKELCLDFSDVSGEEKLIPQLTDEIEFY